MPRSKMPAFDTARLHLRPIGELDEALYCHLYRDPELMRHIAAPMTLEAARRSFDAAVRQQATTRQRWIVCEKNRTAGIGLVGLSVDTVEADVAEIGVMLHAAAQGKGYGTESMAGVIDQAFSTMPLRLLWIRQSIANHPVNGMMVKLAFRRAESTRVGALEHYWELTRDCWVQDASDASRGKQIDWEIAGEHA
jgi:[ribosomal protein S5]-alanine N-acetyltransferase